MKKTFYFSLFLAWIALNTLSAQGKVTRDAEFLSQSYLLGIGTIAYFGDVPSGIATLRPAAILGYSYPFTSKISGRLQVAYGRYSGADSLKSSASNQSRGVHFRSALAEADVLMIYEPFKDKKSPFFKKTHLSPYFVYGLSLFYMNPKAKYIDGTWTELQPLGTEGQNLSPEQGRFNKPYKRIQFNVPFGGGLSYYFYHNIFSINAELMIHKTFTDYMDDVSGEFYADPTLMSNYNLQAAYFANPTGGPITDTKPRGNPKKLDIYMIPSLSISYYIGY